MDRASDAIRRYDWECTTKAWSFENDYYVAAKRAIHQWPCRFFCVLWILDSSVHTPAVPFRRSKSVADISKSHYGIRPKGSVQWTSRNKNIPQPHSPPWANLLRSSSAAYRHSLYPQCVSDTSQTFHVDGYRQPFSIIWSWPCATGVQSDKCDVIDCI